MKVSSTPLNSPSLTLALVGAEAQLADLLPVGIGRRALADAGNLQDLLAQFRIVAGGEARPREGAQAGAVERGDGGQPGRALQQAAPARLSRHDLIINV